MNLGEGRPILRRLAFGCWSSDGEPVRDIRVGCRVRAEKVLESRSDRDSGRSVGAGKSRLYSSEIVRVEQRKARLINDIHMSQKDCCDEVLARKAP